MTDFTQDPVKRVAGAFRRATRDAVENNGGGVRIAIVDSINPITATLSGSDLTVQDGDDLTLSQHVAWWDDAYGISPDDTLYLARTEDNDWVAMAVVSDSEISPVWGGGSGGGGGTTGYVFTQATPATVWVITHGLGRVPYSIMTLDSGGSRFYGQETADSVQVTITLTTPISGKAYLT